MAKPTFPIVAIIGNLINIKSFEAELKVHKWASMVRVKRHTGNLTLDFPGFYGQAALLLPRVVGLVTYITDMLGHFLDMNSVPGFWQCCVRALGQVLLDMVLVLVLRESTESLLGCLPGALAQDQSRAYGCWRITSDTRLLTIFARRIWGVSGTAWQVPLSLTCFSLYFSYRGVKKNKSFVPLGVLYIFIQSPSH